VPGLSRRALLGGGAAAAGVAGAFVAGRASEGSTTVPESARPASAYAFRGAHQAGIVTPAQDRLHFAAFDVLTEDRDELVALLQEWTAAAERMTQGEPAGEVGPVEGPVNLPPDDTGEEERYSHIDLVDFEANVAGARAAFDAVAPILRVRSAGLTEQVGRRFKAVDSALADYRRGEGFVSYTELTRADKRKLSQAIDALAEPLSQVPSLVVG